VRNLRASLEKRREDFGLRFLELGRQVVADHYIDWDGGQRRFDQSQTPTPVHQFAMPRREMLSNSGWRALFDNSGIPKYRIGKDKGDCFQFRAGSECLNEYDPAG
jgi:hypothetical protein